MEVDAPSFQTFLSLLTSLTTPTTDPTLLSSLSSDLHALSPHPIIWTFLAALVLVGKIRRDKDGDWGFVLEKSGETELRSLVLGWVGTESEGRVRRKLSSAVAALSFRLAHLQGEKGWPDWLLETLTSIANRQAVLEVLSVIVEEIATCDLVGGARVRYDQTVTDALPIITRILSDNLTSTSVPDRQAGLRCLESLLTSRLLSYESLTALFPLLGSLLLSPSTMASSASCLCEFIATNASPTSFGSNLTDGGLVRSGMSNPLVGFMTAKRTMEAIEWIRGDGVRTILSITSEDEGMRLDLGGESFVDLRRELTKLLVALLDHSIPLLGPSEFPSSSISSNLPLAVNSPPFLELLKNLIAVTATEGYGGVDETCSELTFGIFGTLGERHAEERGEEERKCLESVLVEWISVAVKKVRWPLVREVEWTKDEFERFSYYRHELGDALVDVYYVLRDLMLRFFIKGVGQQLMSPATDRLENVEAALFCISCLHEVVPSTDNTLAELFGPSCFGQLLTIEASLDPSQQESATRLRNTTLSLIGRCAMNCQQKLPLISSRQLRSAGLQTTQTLPCPPSLSWQPLCRTRESEYIRVLEAVSSVLQSMPPEQLSGPVTRKLMIAQTLTAPLLDKHPQAAKKVVLSSLAAFASIVRGLLPPDVDDDDIVDLSTAPELDDRGINNNNTPARTMEYDFGADAQASALRSRTISTVHDILTIWSDDMEVAVELSSLVKSLVPETTDGNSHAKVLLTLDPVATLELISRVLDSSKVAVIVWMTLLGNLVEVIPVGTSHVVASILQRTAEKGMSTLGEGRSILEDVDLLLSFMEFVKKAIRHHPQEIANMPALSSLVLFTLFVLRRTSERLSVVSVLEALIFLYRDPQISPLVLAQHGSATLGAYVGCMLGDKGGNAIAIPRSTLPTLGEALHAVMKAGGDPARTWLKEAVESMGQNVDEKDKSKFLKAVFAARTTKKVRDAVSEFVLVARGLSNTGYGLATS
ncbi:hypothetical protein BT69DRAFT_1277965 [Atractiella rhizophila]|nr:hypothetical protein BT69DRAFT_1277965 [Atractiella rhizophila]